MAARAGRPLDKFELSPNGQASCRQCHRRISKNEQRVGIQVRDLPRTRWRPAYYHRDCCSNEMLLSLNLAGGRRFGEDDPPSIRVAQKLRAELERQMDIKATKRSLVYGERHDLREALRNMRRDFADQRGVELFQVFDNAALDNIVEKLPSTNRELMACQGIGRQRCQRYGASILQLVADYQNNQA